MGTEALRRVRIQEKTKLGEYLVADSGAALVSLVQMNVVEIHTWNSRTGDLERPDRIVLDIDPGPEVSWRQVVEAARVVRETLNALGLRSFVKTTGGRGVHVVAPLTPSADWNACLAFARGVAGTIARHDPARFTTRFAKRGRERRILIDYLRNNRTNTSIAAYSTRARPGAPVSVPLEWNELTTRRHPERFTILTVPRRLASLHGDPWQEYWLTRQRVTRAMVQAVGEVEEVERWRRSGEVSG